MHTPTLTIEDVSKLPAVLTPATYAEMFGFSKRGTQRRLKEGRIPYARQVAGRWYIPTKKALAEFGVVDGEEVR